ncbi:TerC family protein [Paenibacillus sp. MBLB4367]|uniref:TerC family protein n=1 Tax=Paenibacillus sp. MBLB4367 TaxID=3384767 RepID=UPI0039082C73
MDWFLLFLEIMLINIVLSGDNAVVIALASKNLPIEQRKKAIWWGAFGAVGLRLVLTIAAVSLLKVPYIQAAGSFLLMWIAVKLLIEDEGETNVKEATTLGKAVWTIIVADFVMSLDNVLAIAAAAKNDVAVIILGIGLSIPIIVWGSTLVMKLLHKFPVFVFIGAGILGYTAGEMFIGDKKVSEYFHSDLLHTLLPIVLALVVIVAGIVKKLISRTKPNEPSTR